LKGKTSFSEEEMKAFEPSEKIGLVACVNPQGLPHVSLITSIMAANSTQVTLGEFCQGLSKQYIQKNPNIAFLVMTLDKKMWRGRAKWTHLKKDGKDVEKAKLANGLAPIDGKSERPFRIRLAKLKNRIILEIDGQISFDAINRGEDYYQQGQIGFRQMAHTIEASYGGFKVQSVKSKTGF